LEGSYAYLKVLSWNMSATLRCRSTEEKAVKMPTGIIWLRLQSNDDFRWTCWGIIAVNSWPKAQLSFDLHQCCDMIHI